MELGTACQKNVNDDYVSPMKVTYALLHESPLKQMLVLMMIGVLIVGRRPASSIRISKEDVIVGPSKPMKCIIAIIKIKCILVLTKIYTFPGCA